ncbi:hybrid sensor histidine kinase/response regulator [Thiothrix lacustris]|uniref:histidine kinase n=1 Tax=Thiothrix lacustris TaxID=525917 RepID=A0ABY9MMA9_9GAMM|nr:hybrid sensor histidine kinase/response regulator [Thiothrix lacustris]WML89717.1 hybrid sensor histidine kinase/response regulator [Thiothrix lacustris]
MTELTHITSRPTTDFLDEKIRAAISNYLNSALAVLITSLLLAIALISLDAKLTTKVLVWLGFQAFWSSILLFLYWRYRHDHQSIRHMWEYGLELPLSLLTGATWGIGWAVLIEPENITSAFFLSITICAVVLGYVVSTPLHKAVTITGVLACLIPVILMALWLGGLLFYWIAAAATIFAIVGCVYGLKLNQIYMEVLYQREENQRLLDALSKEKQQVETISREKTRILAAASHDLRQPMQAMRLFEGLLAAQLTDSKQQILLDKLSQSSQNLASLLEALLDVAKLDAGAVQIQPRPVELNQLFRQLYQRYADIADTCHIELHYVETHQHLFTDPEQLTRILSNLLDNAIKHMGRSGKILMGVRLQGQGLRLEVWDNGKGIPEQEQQRIFDAFYQVDNPERNRTKGVGLGLSIVKRLTNLLGCELRLISTPDIGCRFILDIPAPLRLTEDALPVVTPYNHAAEPAPSPPQNLHTLLLLEDDREVAEALSAALSAWGLDVRIASNTQKALQHLHDWLPDMLISDYQLEGGDIATTAISAISAHMPHPVPTLILTGNTNPMIIRELQQCHLPTLYKPIHIETLKHAIHTHFTPQV